MRRSDKLLADYCSKFLLMLLLFTGGSLACTGSSSASRDSTGTNRCSDLVLFPVGNVDPEDQYRFDYSDVGFGTTHQSGATVTVTCTSNRQSASVYAFDPSRTAISTGGSVIASCSPVGNRQAWTVNGRVLQFVDCRGF